MKKTSEIDKFFEMLEDHDFDFVSGGDHMDVPVLTYRWCRTKVVSDCPVKTLVEAGEKSMKELGLKRVVCQGHHLRGDTNTGQRVKMTVLRSNHHSIYLLMTAGMPGTRAQAKGINARLAEEIERLAREWSENRE